MQYTFKYAYGHTLLGTFMHEQGVCGNYATLAVAMCSMAGLVARAVTGNAVERTGYFSQW